MIKKKYKIFIVLLTITLLINSSFKYNIMANQNDIYVSNIGDDINGDGSLNNPYATINKAYENTNDNDRIVLLSDIAQKESVNISKTITITSYDQETYTITRQDDFDNGKSMFEFSNLSKEETLTFKNITLDDNYLFTTTVQNAIINVPTSNYKANLILDAKASIINFGGKSAISINGANTKLIMKKDSLVSNNKAATGSHNQYIAGINNNGGEFIMEEGSKVDGIKKDSSNRLKRAIFINYAKATINGIISNNNVETALNIHNSYVVINEKAQINNNSTQYGAIYLFNNSELHFKGELANNNNNVLSALACGIYVVDNTNAATLYIEDGAKIHDNTGLSSAVLSNNVSNIIMNGGSIYKNTIGVSVLKKGSFTLNKGTIKENSVGIVIYNYGTLVNGKIILNDGTIYNNTSDVAVDTTPLIGCLNNSYLYLDEKIIEQNLKIDFINILMNIPALSSLDKAITLDKSMSETYLFNNTTNGLNALKAIDEIQNGTLLTNFFASNKDDAFKMNIDGLANQSQDVYVAIVPVDDDGNKIGEHKIFYCPKTLNGSNTTYQIDLKGTGYKSYAFGLFINNVLPNTKYTVHYITNSNDVIPDKTDVLFTDKDLIPSTTPSKEYYNFVGWYMDEKYTKEYLNTLSYSDIVNNDISILEANLYAKYNPYTYTVKFDINGGNGNINDINAEYDKEFMMPDASSLTKQYYKFVKWNTKIDGSGDDYYPNMKVKNLSNIDNDTVILYAIWFEVPEYTCIKGDGSIWQKGSNEELIFEFIRNNNDAYDYFDDMILVDDNLITTYQKERGSLIIKLSPSYLETLDLNKHLIDALFIDGEVSATFNIIENNKKPIVPNTSMK